MQVYTASDKPHVEFKEDNTPLTEADLVANKVIIDSLTALTPDIPCLSEESADISYATRQSWQRYWLIDPLDGTKEFIERTGEFTVNIALIDGHESVFGIIYAPAIGRGFYGIKGQGAFEYNVAGDVHPIQIKAELDDHIRIVMSRRHGVKKMPEFIAKIGSHEIIHAGSSLKFCLIAAGEADIYPRKGPTSEWDTAAAQCILEQAGGHIIGSDQKPLRYNSKDSLLNPHFLALGAGDIAWASLL